MNASKKVKEIQAELDAEDAGRERFSLNIINRGRVEVRDTHYKNVVVGEAVRFGQDDWFVSSKTLDDNLFLIGRVHSHHVSEVQGRKMILAMLKAYFGIDSPEN